MRLDKLLAHTGYGTRTEVKKLLKSKVVKVDGVVVKDAKQKVDLSQQVVTVFDEIVEYREFVYLMMNKPQNCLSATRDRDYRTVIDLLDDYYLMFDVAPAGRLDRDTEGLVLLTNDGKLAHEIISPKKDVFKRYIAHISGELTESSMKQLELGVEILDGNNEAFVTKPAKVKVIGTVNDLTAVEICITEGKFHQVKRMFASVGCKVVYLKRLAIGSLQLDETLALGEYRELTEEELACLKAEATH
ncbi:MAG: 16S rRNA pseudouridine(516) synthase [Turicibacter sp.]|nr:16S rRNA pseudouridine(516) synthase [Turicibacter sp.]